MGSVARRLKDRYIVFADKNGIEVDFEVIEGELPLDVEATFYAPDPNDQE